MTGREMCEAIAVEFERRTGVKLDPKAIWEMSPTGEIWPVVELYRTLFPTPLTGRSPEKTSKVGQ